MEADAELWYVKEIRPLAEGNPPCIISYEEVVERAVKHFEFDDFDMPMTAIARGNGPKYQALYDTLKTLCDRDERKVESEPEVEVTIENLHTLWKYEVFECSDGSKALTVMWDAKNEKMSDFMRNEICFGDNPCAKRSLMWISLSLRVAWVVPCLRAALLLSSEEAVAASFVSLQQLCPPRFTPSRRLSRSRLLTRIRRSRRTGRRVFWIFSGSTYWIYSKYIRARCNQCARLSLA